MKVTIIGTGYVGLVSGACFAEVGHDVTCVDTDKKKISDLKKNKVSIYEPGLSQMVKKNYSSGRLSFTTKTDEAINGSDIIFIAVGTPSLLDGTCDISYVRQAAEDIGRSINNKYSLIVTMSTVPVGTGDDILRIIKINSKQKDGLQIDVASNPEFLREGSAIWDRMNPSRIVIGVESERSENLLTRLYGPFNSKIVKTNRVTAELAKYACNAYLATKISFINEIANISENINADIVDISKIMGEDPRIGPHFLNAGLGYGGSCFPKDTRALDQIANNQDHKFSLLKSVIEVNNRQKQQLLKKVFFCLSPIINKRIAVLGLSFKPDTDDIRESISIAIIRDLVACGAEVIAHDPVSSENAQKELRNTCVCTSDLKITLKGADALILATEWPIYKQLDLREIKSLMNKPTIFDGRNLFDPALAEAEGFTYFGIGRANNNRDKTVDKNYVARSI